MPVTTELPGFFKEYYWEDKHSLYGYPADSYPEFMWINSLEKRFDWLKRNHVIQMTASIYLVREMIQWGGSQNGVLQKFEDRLGEVNLYNIICATIENLNDTEKAIESALLIPGMGLTYASKLLRFLDPEKYGALDSRVRSALSGARESNIPKIYDGNTNSMVRGYKAFITYIETLKEQLNNKDIARPKCALSLGGRDSGWRAADIEMALFKWAESDKR